MCLARIILSFRSTACLLQKSLLFRGSVWWAKLLPNFCFSHMTVCSKHSMFFCKQLFPFFRRRKTWAEAVDCSQTSLLFKNMFPQCKNRLESKLANSVFCRELSHCRTGALISGKLFCKVYLGQTVSSFVGANSLLATKVFFPLSLLPQLLIHQV